MSNEAPKNKEKKTFLGRLFSKEHKKSIECQVDLIIFDEDDVHYVYSPALDLMGYGNTADEALQSWEVVIEEYLKYGLNKNTLVKDLQSHGWNIGKKQKQFQPPTLSWMLEHNNQLSEVYNNHNFRKTSHPISLPLQHAVA